MSSRALDIRQSREAAIGAADRLDRGAVVRYFVLPSNLPGRGGPNGHRTTSQYTPNVVEPGRSDGRQRRRENPVNANTQAKTERGAAERPLLVSVVEEVKRTGLPRSTVYALCASGEVRHVRHGRSVMLHRDALDEYIARQTEAAMAGLGG